MQDCEQDHRQEKSKAGQVYGNAPEDRVKTLYNHIKNLFGDYPTVTDEEEKIETVLQNVDIADGPSTMA